MSFKRLDPQDVAISAESVVAPLWSTGLSTLANTSFFTASTQVASNTGQFYYEISQTNPTTTTTAQVQFSIAYADKQGSGSLFYNSSITGSSPSSTIYGQYRSLVLGSEDADFTFGNIVSEKFFALSINRSRYKEKLLPGTFNMSLTGGGTTLKLTDDSNESTTLSYIDAGRVYNIVSGSDGTSYNGIGGLHPTLNATYGKFLPDIGVIILNADALNTVAPGGIDLQINSGSNTLGSNQGKLYNAFTSTGGLIKLQSEETITSNYVFVRARNSEFNYSTNPSNITGSGDLRWNIMVNSPQSYITTVGLYNDNNELLAAAKISRPLLKDFTKEALLRIKLDY